MQSGGSVLAETVITAAPGFLKPTVNAAFTVLARPSGTGMLG
jgi:hypothetical protein